MGPLLCPLKRTKTFKHAEPRVWGDRKHNIPQGLGSLGKWTIPTSNLHFLNVGILPVRTQDHTEVSGGQHFILEGHCPQPGTFAVLSTG